MKGRSRLRRSKPPGLQTECLMDRLLARLRLSHWTVLVLPLAAETPAPKVQMITQTLVKVIRQLGLLCV